MTGPMNDRQARLEEYLDGTLSPADRAAFEREIEADAALKAEVQTQRRADEALRRMFAPPAVAALPIPAPALRVAGGAPAPAPAAASRRRLFPLLAAAAAVAVGAGVWLTVFARGPAARADDLYRTLVQARGFRPQWVCADDAQVRSYTRDRLGESLTIAAAPETTLVGWVYVSDLMGEQTDVLLATVEGDKVLVVFDKASEDRPLKAPSDSGLHVFRRRLDNLVLYEITPKDRAVVLDRVAKAD